MGFRQSRAVFLCDFAFIAGRKSFFEEFAGAVTRGVTGAANDCHRQMTDIPFQELAMIKPINSPVLSSANPRCGLQKVSELIPRLIQQYEIQAEITRARQEEADAKEAAMVDAAMLRQAKAALFEGDTEAWMQEPIGMPAIGRNDSADPSGTITDAVQQSFLW
jgi:hypothetical protein